MSVQKKHRLCFGQIHGFNTRLWSDYWDLHDCDGDTLLIVAWSQKKLLCLFRRKNMGWVDWNRHVKSDGKVVSWFLTLVSWFLCSHVLIFRWLGAFAEDPLQAIASATPSGVHQNSMSRSCLKKRHLKSFSHQWLQWCFFRQPETLLL